ncbi:MAG: hypothetical protein LAO08_19045 [Acidobacteriia bacterium]|nr:hypothetical protein [Terriglobia bacterium]
MVEFRARRGPVIPGRIKATVADTAPRDGREKRRGVRLNSRVPVAVEWESAGEPHRGEAQTRVVGPYGCLVVLPQDLRVKQQIQLTNLVSQQSNPAVIVWRGNERAEGWELGIELINPQMGFWGVEL